MPLGNSRVGSAAGPYIQPRTFPGEQTAQIIAPPADNWQHFTIPAAELAGGAVKRIEAATTTRLVVLELDGIALYIRFGQDAAAVAGMYDLLHPGGGELDRSTPPFQVITFVAASNPTSAVEVWCLDGIYADRPT